ncbi:MAG TPA: hypothetical protein VLJ21_04925, partial [Candidatus Binatia bacterium]|nr:hypothetical protein [Candidatus Binatia bacterium]
MAKGSLHYETLISILLVVVVILLLLAYGYQLVGRGNSYADAAECRESIKRNSALRFGSTEFSSKITCPIKDVTLSGSEDTIKARFAEELYQCWNTWGEGKLELFGDSKETFCAVCSRILFDA